MVEWVDDRRRFEPQSAAGDTNPPPTTEGDGSRVTVLDHLAEQRRLAPGDPLQSDA
jgi:hypothetical protein